jgi:hypothetical protein
MTHVFIFLMVVSDSELLDPFKYVEVGPKGDGGDGAVGARQRGCCCHLAAQRSPVSRLGFWFIVDSGNRKL